MSPGKLVPGFPTDHRILWITLSRKAVSLWITCIFPEKIRPEKSLKTPTFSVIIGTLYRKSYPHVFPFVHILWKVMWNSTGCPQVYVDELCISAGRTRRHSYKRHAEGFQWIM